MVLVIAGCGASPSNAGSGGPAASGQPAAASPTPTPVERLGDTTLSEMDVQAVCPCTKSEGSAEAFDHNIPRSTEHAYSRFGKLDSIIVISDSNTFSDAGTSEQISTPSDQFLPIRRRGHESSGLALRRYDPRWNVDEQWLYREHPCDKPGWSRTSFVRSR
jgi:hypothetical protein